MTDPTEAEMLARLEKIVEALRAAGAKESADAMASAIRLAIKEAGSLKAWASNSQALAAVGAGLSSFVDYALAIAQAVLNQQKSPNPFPAAQVFVVTTAIASLTFVTVYVVSRYAADTMNAMWDLTRIDWVRLENGDFVRDYTGMGGGGGSTFP